MDGLKDVFEVVLVLGALAYTVSRIVKARTAYKKPETQKFYSDLETALEEEVKRVEGFEPMKGSQKRADLITALGILRNADYRNRNVSFEDCNRICYICHMYRIAYFKESETSEK